MVSLDFSDSVARSWSKARLLQFSTILTALAYRMTAEVYVGSARGAHQDTGSLLRPWLGLHVPPRTWWTKGGGMENLWSSLCEQLKPESYGIRGCGHHCMLEAREGVY